MNKKSKRKLVPFNDFVIALFAGVGIGMLAIWPVKMSMWGLLALVIGCALSASTMRHLLTRKTNE